MTGQLLRFGMVGVANTLLTLAAYAALTRCGVDAAVASAVGFALGALNGYLANARWTFKARGRLLAYVTVQGTGAALSAIGVALARGDLSLGRLPAEAVTLPLVTLGTFTLARTVVFAPAAP